MDSNDHFPPTDLHEICRNLGIDVYEDAYWDPPTKLLLATRLGYGQDELPYGFTANFWDDGRYEIHVRKRRNPRLERLTFAHEVAHIILGHTDIAETNISRVEGEDQYKACLAIELAADYLALELLMPREVFIDVFMWCNGDVSILADVFDVHPNDVQQRLVWLRAEDPALYLLPWFNGQAQLTTREGE